MSRAIFLGENSSDNVASTSSVISNANGSILERLEWTQEILRDLLASSLGLQDIGDIFYIDGGSTGPADDTGAGTSRGAPKKIFQSAYDLTTGGNNDVVVVLNYGSAGRALETFPIELDTDQVHIVGVGNASNAWAAMAPPSASATHCFEVTGNRNTISNLCINGGNGKAGIHVTSPNAPWGLLVRQCIFGVDNVHASTLDGILVDSGGDAPYLTVLDCIFYGTLVGGGLTGDGIKIDGNATRGRFGKRGQGNFFSGLASGKKAINISGSAVGIAIEGNTIAAGESATGAAIALSAGSSDCWIDDNHAAFGKTAAGSELYSDGGTANHWGINYSDITAQLPA